MERAVMVFILACVIPMGLMAVALMVAATGDLFGLWSVAEGC